MQNSYTRQRQGRDFFNHLASAEMSVEGNYNNIDGIVGNAPPKDDGEEKRDFLNRLDYFKTEAERNSAPVDGHEPVTERTR
jgi:hypothetical protein